jgi:hypothetical protein
VNASKRQQIKLVRNSVHSLQDVVRPKEAK